MWLAKGVVLIGSQLVQCLFVLVMLGVVCAACVSCSMVEWSFAVLPHNSSTSKPVGFG